MAVNKKSVDALCVFNLFSLDPRILCNLNGYNILVDILVLFGSYIRG